MSTKIKESLIKYTVLTILIALISFTYEHYSHGVYSNYMVYSFVIPLVLGVLPCLVSLINPSIYFNSSLQKIFHNFAITTLSIGAFFEGVVEIYGTTTQYTIYYLIFGLAFLALATIMHFVPSYAQKFD